MKRHRPEVKKARHMKNRRETEMDTISISPPARPGFKGSYEDVLAAKVVFDQPTGFEWPEEALTNGGTRKLRDDQKAIIKWALKRGRAAIFADTGLGKSAMQASWSWAVSQYTGSRVLILAPLCVAPQTVEEADLLGIPMRYVRHMPLAGDTGIFITNYEMIEHFAAGIESGYFDGIVLDESSIIKNQDGKTRRRLTELCAKVPYRLSCTATPAPNDYMELGTQAEFLGVMKHVEMLAMFFIRNGKIRLDAPSGTSEWRLKGHAKIRFWEWLAQWACFIKKPSDLGFSDEGFDLPPLVMEEIVIQTGKPVGVTMTERLRARRESIDERVARTAALVNASREPFIVWCNLNEESSKLAAAIPDAVEIRGSDKIEVKEARILAFTEGRARVIITKPSITGYGLNWQHCWQMAVVGLSDSYEDLYQAIRRCFRFGQKRSVRVVMVSADAEGAVLENIKRKEAQAKEMSEAMMAHMRDFVRREVTQSVRQVGTYERDRATGPDWDLHLGDCVDVARELPDDSIDFSVFSPPFASLFTYSNLERDMGNCKDHAVFWAQFEFFVHELLRIMRPGRNVSVHCCNLVATKQTDGYIGIKGFRNDLIDLFKRVGFHYHSEVTIWRDPVVEMQRTKSHGLLWKQVRKDASICRQGMPDYVVTFRKPGVNTKPVTHTMEELPVKLWQELASPVWFDIVQGNTLNRKLAREESDERHICPLQLDLIERLMLLWSAPDDLVFSPFAGIGSEGYVATAMGRRFVGSEIKRRYFELACENLEAAPRGVQFPTFQRKVGDWVPGVERLTPPLPAPRALRTEIDDSQLDIEKYIGGDYVEA